MERKPVWIEYVGAFKLLSNSSGGPSTMRLRGNQVGLHRCSVMRKEFEQAYITLIATRAEQPSGKKAARPPALRRRDDLGNIRLPIHSTQSTLLAYLLNGAAEHMAWLLSLKAVVLFKQHMQRCSYTARIVSRFVERLPSCACEDRLHA